MREKVSMPEAGRYNPKDDYVRKNYGSIAFGPRPPKPPSTLAKVEGPGPGSYTVPTTLERRIGAVMVGNKGQPRRPRFNSPGPGSYSLTMNNFGTGTKRGIILLSRPKEKRHSETSPGPGSYNTPSKTFVSSNKGIILLGRHNTESTKETSPGPGQYEVKAKYFNNDMRKISFGHGNRFQTFTSPAPGKNFRGKPSCRAFYNF